MDAEQGQDQVADAPDVAARQSSRCSRNSIAEDRNEKLPPRPQIMKGGGPSKDASLSEELTSTYDRRKDNSKARIKSNNHVTPNKSDQNKMPSSTSKKPLQGHNGGDFKQFVPLKLSSMPNRPN